MARVVKVGQLKHMWDAAGVPVAATAVFATGMGIYSGIRCFVMNPDVRRTRKSLHEPVPGDDVAKAAAPWIELHEKRHLRNEVANIGTCNAFGLKRKSSVEEFFGSSRQ